MRVPCIESGRRLSVSGPDWQAESSAAGDTRDLSSKRDGGGV